MKSALIELTGLRAEDSDVLYGWINDAETVRFNAPYKPVDRASHDGWFSSVSKNPSRVVFAIRKVNNPKLIGVVHLFDIQPIHRTAELSIRIGQDEDRGKGIGSEAVKLVLKHAWTDLNLQRVWLRVFHTNTRAIGAYKKAGMQIEGTMKKACFIDGKYVDEHIMAILRD